jgi:hypothetical protein
MFTGATTMAETLMGRALRFITGTTYSMRMELLPKTDYMYMITSPDPTCQKYFYHPPGYM